MISVKLISIWAGEKQTVNKFDNANVEHMIKTLCTS